MSIPTLTLLSTILAIVDDGQEEIDHVYYYDNEDGPISESDKMDEELEDIEYRTKFDRR